MIRNSAALLLAITCAACGGGSGGGAQEFSGTPPSPTAPLPLPPAPPPPAPAPLPTPSPTPAPSPLPTPSPTPAPSPLPTPSPPPSGGSEFSLSQTSLSFVSDNRLVAPAAQQVTATINTGRTGTLYIRYETTGTAVAGISNIGRTTTGGYGSVFPQDPNLLGTGTHTATVTVRACFDDPTCATGQLFGSPRTVNVTYTVQAPRPLRDGIYPNTIIGGFNNEVVLRGTGFTGVTSVSFGSTAVSNFTLVSDTEIRVRAPNAPGDHAVTLNSGAHPFSARLTIIDQVIHTAALLPYPAPLPASGQISRVRFDARRGAALVTLRSATPAENRLVRYVRNGDSWSAPQVATIDGLRDVIVGPAGDSLIGYTDFDVLEINPVTLAVTGTYRAPNMRPTDPAGYRIRGMALANDGHAFLVFGCECSTGSAPIYLYETSTHAIRQVEPGGDFGRPGLSASGANTPMISASEDGGIVFIGPYTYNPALTGGFSRPTFIHLSRGNNGPPLIEMDTHGTRLSLSALYDQSDSATLKTDVFDAGYQRLGRVQGSATDAVEFLMSAVSPDARLVHVLEFNQQTHAAVRIASFSVQSNIPATSLPDAFSAAVPSVVVSDTLPGMTVTPDDRALLLAADAGVYVLPTP